MNNLADFIQKRRKKLRKNIPLPSGVTDSLENTPEEFFINFTQTSAALNKDNQSLIDSNGSNLFVVFLDRLIKANQSEENNIYQRNVSLFFKSLKSKLASRNDNGDTFGHTGAKQSNKEKIFTAFEVLSNDNCLTQEMLITKNKEDKAFYEYLLGSSPKTPKHRDLLVKGLVELKTKFIEVYESAGHAVQTGIDRIIINIPSLVECKNRYTDTEMLGIISRIFRETPLLINDYFYSTEFGSFYLNELVFEKRFPFAGKVISMFTSAISGAVIKEHYMNLLYDNCVYFLVNCGLSLDSLEYFRSLCLAIQSTGMKQFINKTNKPFTKNLFHFLFLNSKLTVHEKEKLYRVIKEVVYFDTPGEATSLLKDKDMFGYIPIIYLLHVTDFSQAEEYNFFMEVYNEAPISVNTTSKYKVGTMNYLLDTMNPSVYLDNVYDDAKFHFLFMELKSGHALDVFYRNDLLCKSSLVSTYRKSPSVTKAMFVSLVEFFTDECPSDAVNKGIDEIVGFISDKIGICDDAAGDKVFDFGIKYIDVVQFNHETSLREFSVKYATACKGKEMKDIHLASRNLVASTKEFYRTVTKAKKGRNSIAMGLEGINAHATRFKKEKLNARFGELVGKGSTNNLFDLIYEVGVITTEERRTLFDLFVSHLGNVAGCIDELLFGIKESNAIDYVDNTVYFMYCIQQFSDITSAGDSLSYTNKLVLLIVQRGKSPEMKVILLDPGVQNVMCCNEKTGNSSATNKTTNTKETPDGGLALFSIYLTPQTKAKAIPLGNALPEYKTELLQEITDLGLVDTHIHVTSFQTQPPFLNTFIENYKNQIANADLTFYKKLFHVGQVSKHQQTLRKYFLLFHTLLRSYYTNNQIELFQAELPKLLDIITLLETPSLTQGEELYLVQNGIIPTKYVYFASNRRFTKEEKVFVRFAEELHDKGFQKNNPHDIDFSFLRDIVQSVDTERMLLSFQGKDTLGATYGIKRDVYYCLTCFDPRELRRRDIAGVIFDREEYCIIYNPFVILFNTAHIRNADMKKVYIELFHDILDSESGAFLKEVLGIDCIPCPERSINIDNHLTKSSNFTEFIDNVEYIVNDDDFNTLLKSSTTLRYLFIVILDVFLSKLVKQKVVKPKKIIDIALINPRNLHFIFDAPRSAASMKLITSLLCVIVSGISQYIKTPKGFDHLIDLFFVSDFVREGLSNTVVSFMEKSEIIEGLMHITQVLPNRHVNILEVFTRALIAETSTIQITKVLMNKNLTVQYIIVTYLIYSGNGSLLKEVTTAMGLTETAEGKAFYFSNINGSNAFSSRFMTIHSSGNSFNKYLMKNKHTSYFGLSLSSSTAAITGYIKTILTADEIIAIVSTSHETASQMKKAVGQSKDGALIEEFKSLFLFHRLGEDYGLIGRYYNSGDKCYSEYILNFPKIFNNFDLVQLFIACSFFARELSGVGFDNFTKHEKRKILDEIVDEVARNEACETVRKDEKMGGNVLLNMIAKNQFVFIHDLVEIVKEAPEKYTHVGYQNTNFDSRSKGTAKEIYRKCLALEHEGVLKEGDVRLPMEYSLNTSAFESMAILMNTYPREVVGYYCNYNKINGLQLFEYVKGAGRRDVLRKYNAELCLRISLFQCVERRIGTMLDESEIIATKQIFDSLASYVVFKAFQGVSYTDTLYKDLLKVKARRRISKIFLCGLIRVFELHPNEAMLPFLSSDLNGCNPRTSLSETSIFFILFLMEQAGNPMGHVKKYLPKNFNDDIDMQEMENLKTEICGFDPDGDGIPKAQETPGNEYQSFTSSIAKTPHVILDKLINLGFISLGYLIIKEYDLLGQLAQVDDEERKGIYMCFICSMTNQVIYNFDNFTALKAGTQSNQIKKYIDSIKCTSRVEYTMHSRISLSVDGVFNFNDTIIRVMKDTSAAIAFDKSFQNFNFSLRDEPFAALKQVGIGLKKNIQNVLDVKDILLLSYFENNDGNETIIASVDNALDGSEGFTAILERLKHITTGEFLLPTYLNDFYFKYRGTERYHAYVARHERVENAYLKLFDKINEYLSILMFFVDNIHIIDIRTPLISTFPSLTKSIRGIDKENRFSNRFKSGCFDIHIEYNAVESEEDADEVNGRNYSNLIKFCEKLVTTTQAPPNKESRIEGTIPYYFDASDLRYKETTTKKHVTDYIQGLFDKIVSFNKELFLNPLFTPLLLTYPDVYFSSLIVSDPERCPLYADEIKSTLNAIPENEMYTINYGNTLNTCHKLNIDQGLNEDPSTWFTLFLRSKTGIHAIEKVIINNNFLNKEGTSFGTNTNNYEYTPVDQALRKCFEQYGDFRVEQLYKNKGENIKTFFNATLMQVMNQSMNMTNAFKEHVYYSGEEREGEGVETHVNINGFKLKRMINEYFDAYFTRFDDDIFLSSLMQYKVAIESVIDKLKEGTFARFVQRENSLQLVVMNGINELGRGGTASAGSIRKIKFNVDYDLAGETGEEEGEDKVLVGRDTGNGDKLINISDIQHGGNVEQWGVEYNIMIKLCFSVLKFPEGSVDLVRILERVSDRKCKVEGNEEMNRWYCKGYIDGVVNTVIMPVGKGSVKPNESLENKK